MDKSSSKIEMDLEEWELLLKDDPSKGSSDAISNGDSKGIVNIVDYSEDPSGILLESIDDWGKVIKDQDEKVIKDITVNKVEPRKDKESFDSPLFLNKSEDDGLINSNESKEEEREKNVKGEAMVVDEYLGSSDDDKEKGLWNGVGFNVFGWRFSGMGALCTIGVAAATICIFILGTRSRQKQHHQKIQFQIYSDDKNLKQMMEQATRLNSAISATKGVPTTRANITIGGNYAGA